jgi:hypothetical protein
MANPNQRVIFTNGQNSYLFEGDPEKDDDRFFFIRNGSRQGCALPVLLSEGWTVLSVTGLQRQAKPEDDWGSTVVVVQRSPY